MTSATLPLVPVSYGINVNVGRQAEANLAAPASTVLLFEVAGVAVDVSQATALDTKSVAANGGDGGGAGWIDWSYGTAVYDTGLMGSPPRTTASGRTRNLTSGRHSDKATFLMADGHAKTLDRAQVSPGSSNNNSLCAQDTAGTSCSGANGAAAGTSNSQFAATFSAQ